MRANLSTYARSASVRFVMVTSQGKNAEHGKGGEKLSARLFILRHDCVVFENVYGL